MNAYDVGDQVRLSVLFSDAAAVATDPTVISVLIGSPVGTVTILSYSDDLAVSREGDGAYYVDIVVDRPGTWSYRWQASGTVTAAAEGRFIVRRSAFA